MQPDPSALLGVVGGPPDYWLKHAIAVSLCMLNWALCGATLAYLAVLLVRSVRTR